MINPYQQIQKYRKDIEDLKNTNAIYLFTNPYRYENSIHEDVADVLLPVDTGIEIECHINDNYDINFFRNIPNIIEVKSCTNEQRFRIPPGIKGLRCLYDISKNLKKYCITTDSGIHIHSDATDYSEFINNENMKEASSWILKALDYWEYDGKYNVRQFGMSGGVWIRYQSYFKSIEIRIFKMTFNYSKLLKIIIDSHLICLTFRDFLLSLYNVNDDISYTDIKNIVNDRLIKF
jgi:hypothetical protein